MHIAITMGLFLLGGWAVDSPSPDDSAATEPAQTRQAAPSNSAPSSTPTTSGARTPISNRLQNPEQMAASKGASGPSSSAEREGLSPKIPLNPTESRGVGAAGPIAPTSPFDSTKRAVPLAPTSSMFFPPSGAGAQQSRTSAAGMMSPMMRNAPSASPQLLDKPFTGYRPQSGVSPYSLLFQRNGQTNDNYSNLVRPQLEQRNLNQQFNNNIYGLERNTSQIQQTMLQQANQPQRGTAQGIATPQFQNMGAGGQSGMQNYYPGQGFGP
jgi:hypothetical protein